MCLRSVNYSVSRLVCKNVLQSPSLSFSRCLEPASATCHLPRLTVVSWLLRLTSGPDFARLAPWAPSYENNNFRWNEWHLKTFSATDSVFTRMRLFKAAPIRLKHCVHGPQKWLVKRPDAWGPKGLRARIRGPSGWSLLGRGCIPPHQLLQWSPGRRPGDVVI